MMAEDDEAAARQKYKQADQDLSDGGNEESVPEGLRRDYGMLRCTGHCVSEGSRQSDQPIGREIYTQNGEQNFLSLSEVQTAGPVVSFIRESNLVGNQAVRLEQEPANEGACHEWNKIDRQRAE